jgi:indolepyruvate ferredoxin oxidoreductase beta subunit
LIDYAQADLLIGLDKNEAMLNLPYLKRGGKAVVNADNFVKIDAEVYKVDANKLIEKNLFDVKGLNVFMLGVVLAKDDKFPFSINEVKDAIQEMNPKFAKTNFEILDKAVEYAKNI